MKNEDDGQFLEEDLLPRFDLLFRFAASHSFDLVFSHENFEGFSHTLSILQVKNDDNNLVTKYFILQFILCK